MFFPEHLLDVRHCLRSYGYLYEPNSPPPQKKICPGKFLFYYGNKILFVGLEVSATEKNKAEKGTWE